MNEAEFTTRLRKWIRHRFDETAAIEVKYTEGQSINFNELKDHQLDALKRTNEDTLSFKIPDDSRGRKPFDLMVYTQENAYVCLHFYEYAETEFFLIDVEDWTDMVASADRKSVTEDMAREYATIVGNLGE